MTDGNGSGNGHAGYDPAALARNLAQLVEESGRAAAAWLRPRERDGLVAENRANNFGEALTVLGRVGLAWLKDPMKLAESQRAVASQYAGLWVNTMRRLAGDQPAPVAEPDARDKRFTDPEWSNNPFFDFFKQSYLIGSRWASSVVEKADLDPTTRHHAEFYLRQIVSAFAPSNFVPTNPELLRRTFETNGENLVRGMRMLAEDIAAGDGRLKIRQTDTAKFEVGRNLAITPGKVIHQNDICQIIQYEPATPDVLKRPLLIVPPWINKFYILDLTAEKSFIRWCVAQGHTVFVISWVNPDQRHAGKSFEHYIREGIFTGLDVVAHVTGEKEVNAIGYCVGGTLLAAALAYMAETGDERIRSATLFAGQVDFTHAGDLRLFTEEVQVEALEKRMEKHGYLDGQEMASTFNLLRPNDLIWPYVIGNYLMGEPPSAFDLLYWNSDSTRLPAANHAFYLRNCYVENRLATGRMAIGGKVLSLAKIAVPIYELATREDHIAPARSVLEGARLFGGPVTFVVGGSGHIAGVINPPAKNKYQYWTGGDLKAADLDAWFAGAEEHPGSWWPHWQAWIERLDGRRVPARKVGGKRKYKPIEDAPGSYVKVRS